MTASGSSCLGARETGSANGETATERWLWECWGILGNARECSVMLGMQRNAISDGFMRL